MGDGGRVVADFMVASFGWVWVFSNRYTIQKRPRLHPPPRLSDSHRRKTTTDYPNLCFSADFRKALDTHLGPLKLTDA